MPTLILSGDTLSIRVQHDHLVITRHNVDGEGLELKRHNRKQTVPILDIDRVLVIGRPSITVPFLQKMMFSDVPVYFLTMNNRWVGMMTRNNNMNAARRVRQYEAWNNLEIRLKVSQALIFAKIRNSRRVLQRLGANRKQSTDQEQYYVMEELWTLAERTRSVKTIDQLRGIEGLAASIYFSRLGTYFPDVIPFTERSRRPPRDEANALLSWAYTIVSGEIEAAIRSHGLDPCIGFMHSLSHGTPSLVVDLIEPLRAPLCDMLVLHLLNHKILKKKDFIYDIKDGGTYIKKESHKDFFFQYETTMQRKFTSAKGEEQTDFRKIIESSVMTVIKILEGRGECNFFMMP